MSDETTFFLHGNSVTCVILKIVIEHLIISTQMQSHTHKQMSQLILFWIDIKNTRIISKNSLWFDWILFSWFYEKKIVKKDRTSQLQAKSKTLLSTRKGATQSARTSFVVSKAVFLILFWFAAPFLGFRTIWWHSY